MFLIIFERFKLESKFEPFFSAQFPLHVGLLLLNTSAYWQLSIENVLFCGRLPEDYVEINILDAVNFSKKSKFNDDDKITCFTFDTQQSVSLLFSSIIVAVEFVCWIEEPFAKKDWISINESLKNMGGNAELVFNFWMQSCHQRSISKIAVNLSGTRLATGSGDTVVRLWHIGHREGFSASCRGHNSMIT